MSLRRILGLDKPARRGPKPKRPIARNSAPIKRAKRVRKASLRDLPKLRKKLWDKFAAYVKERDGNVCFTCDKPGLEGAGWHAGHMVKRTRASVCYDPANVHSQCAGCNLALDGNGAVYALRHMAKYGEAKTVAVLARAKELKKWKPFEIEELIAALDKGGADFECLYAEKYSA